MENISVNKGIGKIETFNGNINDYIIRRDFQELEKEFFRLYEYSKVFSEHNIKAWIHLKNHEDFNKIYSLEYTSKRKYEKIYENGKDLSYYMGGLLSQINDIKIYPNLTSFVEKLEISWIKDIDLLETTLLESTQLLESSSYYIYSVEEMNKLFKEEIEILKIIKIILITIKESNLYKKENNLVETDIKTEKKDSIDEIPNDIIKEVLKYIKYFKKYPLKGMIVIIFSISVYYNQEIYNYYKQDINIKIFKKEAPREDIIIMGHIFNAGMVFQDYYNEIKRNTKNNELSIAKNALFTHFSALGFNDEKLLNYEELDLEKIVINLGTLRSKFEGFLSNKYPNQQYLFNVGSYLFISSEDGTEFYFKKFNENWNKFKDSFEYVSPSYDIKNIKTKKDIKSVSTKILLELKIFFNK